MAKKKHRRPPRPLRPAASKKMRTVSTPATSKSKVVGSGKN